MVVYINSAGNSLGLKCACFPWSYTITSDLGFFSSAITDRELMDVTERRQTNLILEATGNDHSILKENKPPIQCLELGSIKFGRGMASIMKYDG